MDEFDVQWFECWVDQGMFIYQQVGEEFFDGEYLYFVVGQVVFDFDEEGVVLLVDVGGDDIV